MRAWPAALPALLLAGQAAHAEYGATRWGMTPDAVVAAVGADAHLVRDNRDERSLNHRKLATSTFTEDGIAYVANYYFGEKGKGLTLVRIEPAAPEQDCEAMLAAHTARLGPGIVQPKSIMTDDFSAKTIQWRTGPGEQVAEYTEVRLGGRMRYCHVLHQERDFVQN
ncbi:MAG: hypothetical protein GC147_07745 [Porphyrobacter sp.]|nr:hypothetical protein [Porphyrobacter sp.]